jgi:hypothetical protein
MLLKSPIGEAAASCNKPSGNKRYRCLGAASGVPTTGTCKEKKNWQNYDSAPELSLGFRGVELRF